MIIDSDGVLLKTSLEERSEVASLETLHHQRRELIQQNAPLIARYGPFGMHDDFRKQRVEALKTTSRLALEAREVKITEARVDAEAYGSDAYATFLNTALQEKVEYLRVQNEIDELNERIYSRGVELLAYGKEIGLGR